MREKSVLFRARVPERRLKNASKILNQLGLKPGEAFNILLAQIELRRGLPFEVTARPKPLLTSEEQGTAWNEAFGAY
jgi:addiction module RelB/DinJ family antitoxin